MKSFEHLIGIFEGVQRTEDMFLKGNKTEGRFLATYTLRALLHWLRFWRRIRRAMPDAGVERGAI